MPAGEFIDYYETVWSQNKARGIYGQARFENEFIEGLFSKHKRKFFHGCWLISQKSSNFYRFRFCVFVHDIILKDVSDVIDPQSLLGQKDRPFYAIAEYMKNAGIGIIYAVPVGKISLDTLLRRDYSSLDWHIFFYEDDKLVKKVRSNDFFNIWAGKGGGLCHRLKAN